MDVTSDKFDPQMSNDETFPLPGPRTKNVIEVSLICQAFQSKSLKITYQTSL